MIDWDELLSYLRKAAKAMLSGVGICDDWEDAAQEACLAICATTDVRDPRAFGILVIKRYRIGILRSYATRCRDDMELCNVGAQAGFDTALLANNWLNHARELIPPTYRGVVCEDLMSPLHTEGRSPAIYQRCWRARRMMQVALAKVG